MSHSPSPHASPCHTTEVRVLPSEVLAIMLDVDDSYTDDPTLVEPFIMAAHVIVENTLVDAEECIIDDCTLFEIERWLAAHLLATVDQKTMKERYGDGEDTFQGKWDVGFDSTNYGQQVMRMDPCGLLGTINETAKVAKRKLIFQARGR